MGKPKIEVQYEYDHENAEGRWRVFVSVEGRLGAELCLKNNGHVIMIDRGDVETAQLPTTGCDMGKVWTIEGNWPHDVQPKFGK